MNESLGSLADSKFQALFWEYSDFRLNNIPLERLWLESIRTKQGRKMSMHLSAASVS